MWAENEVDMIGEQVNEVIDNLCQKIGSTQQMLVPEMARLCIARSWVDAVFCGVLFLLCSIGLIVSIKSYKEDDNWVIGIVVFSIVAFVFLFLLWASVSNAIQWQAAPTAKAVEYILNLVRSR